MIIKLLYLISLVFAVPTVTNGSYVKENCDVSYDTIICKNFRGPQLWYESGLDNITIIYLAGDFQRLIIDPSFKKIEVITAQPSTSIDINFADYKHLKNLKSIEAFNVGRVTVSVEVLEMRNLREISLKDSTIEDGEGIPYFGYFPALNELILDNMKYYDFDFFYIPNTLEFFKLNSDSVSDIPCQAWRSFNKLRILIFTRTELSEIDLACLPSSLIHLDLSNNYKLASLKNMLPQNSLLQTLTLDDTKLKTFNISTLPPTTETLYLSYTETLSSLTCGRVSHLTKLDGLHLSSNKLTEIDVKCLPESLSWLDVGYNQIMRIDLNLLSKLTTLNLVGNRLEEFNLALLSKNVSSVNIFLADNRITDLQNVGYLRNFEQGSIYLLGNPISCSCSFLNEYLRIMDSEEYDTMCEKGICVECNPNSDFPYTLRDDLTNVTRLDADHNSCLLHAPVSADKGSKFSFDCTYELVYGLYPKIDCVNYKTLQFITNYQNVESVDFSGSFSTFVLDGRYENIAYIKLRSDNLTTFNFASVGEFKKLKFLDLANNRIKTIDTNMYASDPVLKVIDLSNNVISGTSLNFNYYPKLEELRLSHNRLTDFNINLIPKSVRKLDLSHNNIDNIKFRTGTTNSNSLPHFTLDLSSTGLRNLDLTEVKPRTSFELVLNRNRLQYIKSDPSLKFVDFKLQLRDTLVNCDCEFFTAYTTTLADAVTCSSEASCFQCNYKSLVRNFPWWNRTQLWSSFNEVKKVCPNVKRPKIQSPNDDSSGRKCSSEQLIVLISMALYFLAQ